MNVIKLSQSKVHIVRLWLYKCLLLWKTLPNFTIMDYNNVHMLECERSISTHLWHSCLIISCTQPMSNPRQYWYLSNEKQCNSENIIGMHVQYISKANIGVHPHLLTQYAWPLHILMSLIHIITFINTFLPFAITHATIINRLHFLIISFLNCFMIKA